MNTPLNKSARRPRIAVADPDPVEMLELRLRITNRLHAAGIDRVDQLCGHARRDLLKLPHFGARSLQEVEQALQRARRSLRREKA